MNTYRISKVFHLVVDADTEDQAEEIVETAFDNALNGANLGAAHIGGEEILELEEIS